jgi:hypothetical protein
MPRAVLKQGVIHPIEPLPPDWPEGAEVVVERLRSTGNGRQSTDQWMDEVESLAALIPPGEDEKLEEAIKQIRRQAKDLAGRGKR